MSKYSRSGGKYTGNHTTLVPLACVACDIACKLPEVVKITPGFIKAGLPSVNGNRKIKITSDKNTILLSVRDNASFQEVRLYSSEIQTSKLQLAQQLRDEGVSIHFN